MVEIVGALWEELHGLHWSGGGGQERPSTPLAPPPPTATMTTSTSGSLDTLANSLAQVLSDPGQRDCL